MDKKEILARVNEIFKEVFDDETLVITEETTAQDIEDWDSFEHINLIVAIEQNFKIKFVMEEVSGMKNVGEMINIIAGRI
ncbi:MAG: acyl carrier protein [Lachnospiraceae bacterium]|nr:acyl carrier protein [Lachnospiraceae bacterium]